MDVRIIAATNKDLQNEVKDGMFRTDLFYRLNVLPIKLPALRERKEDIPILAAHYSKKLSRKLNKKEVEITQEQMNLLCAYPWPGNIRELENMIELTINSEHLPEALLKNHSHGDILSVSLAPGSGNEALEEVEEMHIKRVLEEHNFNISASAKNLKIGRNTLYRKMRLYGIECS